jgi:hypothetical protein
MKTRHRPHHHSHEKGASEVAPDEGDQTRFARIALQTGGHHYQVE